MAAHDPQSYGWLAAAILALSNALYFVIRWVVPKGGKNPLSRSLQSDFDRLSQSVAILTQKLEEFRGETKEELKETHKKLEKCASDLRVLEVKINGNRGRQS